MRLVRKESISGPSSTLGIIRFFERSKESPKIDPRTVIIFTIVVIVFFVVVHAIT